MIYAWALIAVAMVVFLVVVMPSVWKQHLEHQRAVKFNRELQGLTEGMERLSSSLRATSWAFDEFTRAFRKGFLNE